MSVETEWELAEHPRGKFNSSKKHPLYSTWLSMWTRCYYSSDLSYCHYGGRGICVWEGFKDFRAFVEWMGERPEGHTVDRVDNNGHYVPGNIVWETQTNQVRKTRMSKNNTSGYHGVIWNNRTKSWRAKICVNYKAHHLGLFDCKHEAARAYNEAALKYHGKHAKQNEIVDG